MDEQTADKPQGPVVAEPAADTQIPDEHPAGGSGSAAGAWLKRNWGVPLGLLGVVVFFAMMPIWLQAKQAVDRERFDNTAAKVLRALDDAQQNFYAQQSRFAPSLADLVEHGDVEAREIFADGWKPEITVSESGQTVLLRVRGADQVHAAVLRR